MPLLAAHLRTGRIAHTYLFTGPEGEAKQEMVLAFAKALNCDEARESFVGARHAVPLRACECSNCQRIEKGIYPDVRWLGEDEEERSIKIEQIRNLIHESSLKPFEGRWKVFILKGAERLTLEAANALLKTLEEPPERSVFLLLVENKAHLLETIQSRAFEVRTPPPVEKDPLQHPSIRTFLEEGPGPFLSALQTASRRELAGELEALMLYLRDRSAEAWEKKPAEAGKYLKALERVYETQEAVDANVNQKLALTHLEIHLGRLYEEACLRRSRGTACRAPTPVK